MNRVITASLLLQFCLISTGANRDSLNVEMFNGSVGIEVNHGAKYLGDSQTEWDLPHIVLDGNVNLSKGWNIVTQLEYEHLHEDDEWGSDVSVNKLYFSKCIVDAFQFKAGIIDLPIGIVNSGGNALTIYDPENESDLLPLTWHEAGVAFFGDYGNMDYSLSASSYISAALTSMEILGVSVRADYFVMSSFRVGLSGYVGKACHGMISESRPESFDGGHINYAAFDIEYQSGGLVSEGSMIYCGEGNSKSAGIEIGYDVLSLRKSKKCNSQVIPFVRYDGIWSKKIDGKNKYTLGVNIVPFSDFIIKAEYGLRKYQYGSVEHLCDISVGYAVNF